MEFGVVSQNTEYGIRPDVAARAAEERGFESVWFPEHTHIPAKRETPYALGGDLPKQYWHFQDLFVSMTAAVMATTRIKVGSGVCLLIEHHPINAAKAIATLDVLSDGRVMFGVGGGWNAEEMANHGTAFADRWKVLRERVAACKAIWTQEEASYHGRFVDFDRIWCYPKPLQRPHPPVLLGAITGVGLQRVVDYCDGWLVVGPSGEDLARAQRELAERCARAGRDPATIPITVFVPQPMDAALLDTYAAAGVARVVQFLPPDTADEALALIDHCAAFIDRYR